MARALTASASVISVGDKAQAKTWGKIRPGWQAEAWAYRRNLGELRYACAYLGNSAMRIRMFPASYIQGNEVPVPVALAPDIPDDLKRAAEDTLLRLASGGPLALAMMQKKLTENFEVAGETFLIGETDPASGLESWTLRSTSELLVTNDGTYKVLEFPGATARDARELDPGSTFVSRMWWPDPEWGMLADSPVRSILDLCEELLLLGKDVRATARSRLALNGILGIPDSLSIVGANPESSMDPNSDPFWQTLIETVTAALTNEGSAASVVPLMLRGPAEALAAIKHITLDRPEHRDNIAQRTELIQRMATGIDLPGEVLTGKADLNHWSSWQVDDDAFRHHIEPIQVVENDAITAGFMWPILDAYENWDPALIRKVLVWHDATELLTHPDRAADAFQAWDRFAISDGALRNYLGFPVTDEPNSTELLTRIVTKAHTLDPALVETILKRLDPTLPDPTPNALPAGPTGASPVAPPMPPPAPNGPPAQAGIGGGVDVGQQYAIEAMAQGIAKAFMGGALDREQIQIATRHSDIPVTAKPALVASAGVSAADRRASRRLVDIDRELRNKLLVAANLAVKRALEKAGAKVISKARGKGAEAVRASIVGVDTCRVVAAVGPAMIAALGLDAKALSDAEFADLETQWGTWVSTGQDQALRQAARIAGVDSSAMKAQVAGRFKDDASAGWQWLESRLHAAVTNAMSGPPVGADLEFDAGESFVAVGDIRGALSIAGGFNSAQGSAGLTADGQPADPTEVLGQIGTGDTINGVLVDAGMQDAGYEWSHGPSSHPFEPHEALDGVNFQTFTDDALVNDEGFPDLDWYAPGDHDGCSCDFNALWTSTDNSSNDTEG